MARKQRAGVTIRAHAQQDQVKLGKLRETRIHRGTGHETLVSCWRQKDRIGVFLHYRVSAKQSLQLGRVISSYFTGSGFGGVNGVHLLRGDGCAPGGAKHMRAARLVVAVIRIQSHAPLIGKKHMPLWQCCLQCIQLGC